MGYNQKLNHLTKMDLKEFANYVSPMVLKRGIDMFEYDCVEQMDEITENHYRFEINGNTGDYEVNLHLDHNAKTIVDFDCDCPYDREPICKHIVAAILYFNANFVEDDASSSKKAKGMNVIDEIDTIISKAPTGEILDFVKDYYLANSEFRSKLSCAFADYLTTNEDEKYRRIIKSIIKDGSGHHGFIEYREMKKIGVQLLALIDEARQSADFEDLTHTIAICKNMLDEIINLVSSCDDSDGYCHTIFSNTMNVMSDISQSPALSEERRDEIIDHLKDLYNKGRFAEWGWNNSIFNALLNFSRGHKDLTPYLHLLEAELANAKEYKKKRLHEKIYDLIAEIKGKEAAHNYMIQNLDVSSFREKAIREAIKDKNYTYAKKLATQGIKLDKQLSPYGPVGNWNYYLMEIALHTQDKKTQLKLLLEKTIDENASKEKTYEQLKSTAGNRWPEYLQALIKEGQKRATAYFVHTTLLENVYTYEGMWEEIFQLFYASSSPNTDKLIYYQSRFCEKHAKELAMHYLKVAKKYLSNGRATRLIYNSAADLLRHAAQIGYLDDAQLTADKLRTDYPRLKALHDELKKAGF